MENIFLVGFMGSGKTYAAKKISAHFVLRHYDLDDYIEQQEKKTIRNLFEDFGERIFREKERHYLQQLLQEENIVLACGGGTPCFFDNMELMNAAGITVWLNESEDEIFDRLRHEKTNRPLIANKNDEELKQFITDNIRDRKPFYQQAKIHVANVDEVFKALTELSI